MSAEYLIRFEAAKCIQCHGCETACKSWRDLPYGIRYRRVLNLWQGNYPDIKSSSLSLACLHCTDPACAAVCPVEAISKRKSDGRVLVDANLCIGCRACIDACPFGVPQVGEDGIMGKCDLCMGQPLAGGVPPCVGTCPGKALALVKISSGEKKTEEVTVSKMMA